MTRHDLKENVFSIAQNSQLTPSERLSKMLLKLGKTTLLPDGGCFIGNTTVQTAKQMPEFAEILRGIFDDWIEAMAQVYATRFTAEEALQWGLLNEITAADQLQTRALAILKDLVGLGPIAMQSIIASINGGYDLSLGEALELEAVHFGLCCTTHDKAEGVAAFLEKRAAVFSGE